MYDLIARSGSSAFDKIFGDAFRDIFGRDDCWLTPVTYRTNWKPAIDVSEDDNGYNISVEVPGVSKEDLDLSVQDDILVISGEKKKNESVTGRTERFYGSFSRSFRLPSSVDKSRISAKFENGVLYVSITKTVAQKPDKILIE